MTHASAKWGWLAERSRRPPRRAALLRRHGHATEDGEDGHSSRGPRLTPCGCSPARSEARDPCVARDALGGRALRPVVGRSARLEGSTIASRPSPASPSPAARSPATDSPASSGDRPARPPVPSDALPDRRCTAERRCPIGGPNPGARKDRTADGPHERARGMDTEQVEQLNRTVRYTVWAIYAAAPPRGRRRRRRARRWAATLPADDVVLRGLYDVSGMRADADLMVWLHGPSAESLQAALRTFRRTAAGATCTLAWSAMGTHRPAEFSRDHIPSFMQDTQPLPWLCMYPFVRSYEWYLLPDDERRAMLREHGVAGREFTDVQPNTVAAFALNDYEWILALEATELHDLVDMMRDLRPRRPAATSARRSPSTPAASSTPTAPRRSCDDDVRRVPARLVRRPRGPRRRDAVPRERHPRPRHPARAARGGLPPLPRARWGQPDQPAEPRPHRRPARRVRPPRHRPADLLGQPQLGPVPHPGDRAPARRRAPPHPRARDQRLLLLLRLPPVPRGPRTRARRVRPERPARHRQGAPLLRPPRLRRPVRRGHVGSAARDRAEGIATEDVRMLFVTHSIPTAMAAASGPPGRFDENGAYVAQHLATAQLVLDGVAAEGSRSPSGRSSTSRAAARRTSRGSSPTSTMRCATSPRAA
jgi:hydrogen peroxide-dependent heme synthase